MMTENKLYQAFDLQHARMASRELSDAEMEYVSAAGITEPPIPPKGPFK